MKDARPGPTSRSQPPSDSPDNVVPLSQWRARLGRGTRLRRADELIDSAEAATRIRALPPDEFYWVLRETGLHEGRALLRHATAEQIQVAIDFDAWDRDQIVPEKLAEWIDAISEAPVDKIGEWLAGMDVEMLAWILVTAARVYELSTEDPADDEPVGTFWPTPDRLFVIDVFGKVEVGTPPLIRILDALYRCDMDLARRILVGTRGELPSELEDTAYRWRSGRMADFGFADYYEALEVYRELDPASVKIGESKPGRMRPIDTSSARSGAREDDALRAPGALVERLRTGRGAFARAVTGVASPDELGDLHFALVALSNRVLAAERVAPADGDAVSPIVERVGATLDLAVEFLARGAAEREIEAVRTVPLVRLFRLGVSLAGKVGRLAGALRRRGPFAVLGPEGRGDLWEPDDGAVLAALDRRRPMFPRLLDSPPATGERPLGTLDDLARAAAGIERAGAAIAALIGLGVRPEHLTIDALGAIAGGEAASIDTGSIARTVLVARLLGRPSGGFAPLSATEVILFRRTKLDAGLRTRASRLLADAIPDRIGPDATRAVSTRWIDSLSPLESLLVRAGAPTKRSVPAKRRAPKAAAAPSKRKRP